jgi:hypothetical protein
MGAKTIETEDDANDNQFCWCKYVGEMACLCGNTLCRDFVRNPFISRVFSYYGLLTSCKQMFCHSLNDMHIF